MKFQDIKLLTRSGAYQVDFRLDHFVSYVKELIGHDGLQMNPDFQRGHVWTEEQQIRYVEFVLRGGTTGKIFYFNNPNWFNVGANAKYKDFVCVDGLQRYTAIRRFIDNEIKVFGHHYKEYEGPMDTMVHRVSVNVNDLQSKEDVLTWYIDLNDGGIAHTKEEIQRVQDILDGLKNEKS